MRRVASLFGALALLPAMIGPLPAAARASGGGIVVSLCGGGSMVLPGKGGSGPGQANPPCCGKGCRSDDKRKRFDPKQ